MSETSKQPKPPFDANEEMSPPGLESELDPSPRYKAPSYKGADKLKGKVALITGGDSGIGRSVAVLYAREGADVCIVALPEEEADARTTAEAIEQEGQRARYVLGDVKDASFCERAVTECVDALGGLDILVNNAAFQHHVDAIEDLDIEQWDRTFRTNIYGYFHMVKASLPPPQAGSGHHQHGLDHGIRGQQGVDRLRLDQGGDPRLHQVARAADRRARHPRQLRGARARVDAAQSGRAR